MDKKNKLYMFHPKFKKYLRFRFKELLQTQSAKIYTVAYDYFARYEESNSMILRDYLNGLKGSDFNDIYSISDDIIEHYEYADSDEFNKSYTQDIIRDLESKVYNYLFEGKDTHIERTEFAKTYKWYTEKVDDSIIDTSLNFDNTDTVKSLKNGTIGKYYCFLDKLKYAFGGEGYLPNSFVLVTAHTGVGKSLFLLQNAIDLVKQGSKHLYVSVGADLTKSSIISRLMQMYYGRSLDSIRKEFNGDLDKSLDKFKNDFPDLFDENKFKLLILKPDAVNGKEFVDKIQSLDYHNKYDTFSIDYDGHFSRGNNSTGMDMYNAGGELYAQLTNITSHNENIVFIGSQANRSSQTKFSDMKGDKVILGLESISDSSKKANVVSTVISISKTLENGSLQMGYIACVKHRHGKYVELPYYRDNSLVFKDFSDYKMYEATIKSLDNDQVMKIIGKYGNIEEFLKDGADYSKLNGVDEVKECL